MNCTGDDTCKWCNPEPLTLEGDIRYLKAHIETKDRQLAEKDAALAEAKLRIDIYREAWRDAEKETIKLREENERRHSRIVEQNDWLVRLQEENKKLREENDKLYHINCQINNRVAELEQQVITLEGHKARYQEEILQLEQEAETYRIALNKVRVIAEEVGLE